MKLPRECGRKTNLHNSDGFYWFLLVMTGSVPTSNRVNKYNKWTSSTVIIITKT